MSNEAGRGGEGYLAGARAGLPFALVVGVVAISFGFSPALLVGEFSLRSCSRLSPTPLRPSSRWRRS
jgi:hypothetical protein